MQLVPVYYNALVVACSVASSVTITVTTVMMSFINLCAVYSSISEDLIGANRVGLLSTLNLGEIVRYTYGIN